MFLRYVLIDVIVLSLITRIFCDEIFGCGGFVKSNFIINYSRVEIKLYTKHGSLKYQTDCAPNNGYYLIPLYDKGDYILKIEPPSGWNFEPSSISLYVDGHTDPCSLNQDINFTFKGFTVSGQVMSRGGLTGPADIILILKDNTGNIKDQTISKANGHYTFSGLFPNKYVIEAAHKLWIFDHSIEHFQVTDDNVKTENKIIIAGYDVSGYVYSEGEPVQGVYFLLFSQKETGTVLGCNSDKVEGFSNKLTISYVCHITSSSDGKFIFPSLSPGSYKLVPFYKGEHIEFDVSPPEMDFNVEVGSFKFPENFQVQGFGVSGWIGAESNGKSFIGADVFVDGVKYAISNTNGMYHLENMRAGTYLIEVKMPHIFFEPISLKVNPNTPRLPDIYASKFSVCGLLVIDEYPAGLQTPTKRISLKSIINKQQTILSVDTNGEFCFEVSRGKYEIAPIVSELEAGLGLKFIPEKFEIEVVDEPLSDITFKQFRSDVKGIVKCIESCSDVTIDLAPLSDDRLHIEAVVSKDGHFEFEKCLPGNYILTLIKDDWCFKSKTSKFTIIDKNIVALEFQQTGFQATVTLTHSSLFDVKYPSGEIHKVELKNSKNALCLPEQGIYDFIPVGCHLYKKDAYKFDTSNPTELILNPIKHLVTGSILTELNVTDILINATKHFDGIHDTISLQEPVDKKDNMFRYKFSIFVQPNSELEIKVVSKHLLFRPVTSIIKVTNDCIKDAVEIIGKKGIFLNGSIIPPLEDVLIKIIIKESNEIFTKLLTDASGAFQIGPLEDASYYEIQAEKDGYVFTNLKQKGHFVAYKLAEIVAYVESEDELPLSGVLLSLSGGTDYRKNSVTQKNGKFSFTGLGPGQYFLRPMLKEYSFNPSTKMIDIKEGTQVNIKIRGKRVAYSLYGTVSSLTGEAEVGVSVEAVGVPLGSCSQYQEEAISEQGGLFRIRGLRPTCEYILRLKQGAEVNQHIERSTPKELLFKVHNNDIRNIHLIVFRYYGQMDVSGNVITKQEYLQTLKIRLYKDDNPEHIVASTTLGRSTFFYLPSMPIDYKNYILCLESSLSRNSYYLEQSSIIFSANTSFYHFTFSFHPHVKSLDHEVTQGSAMAFPLTIIALILIYNYSKILPLVIQLFYSIKTVINPNRAQTMENVSSETNLKRKTKSKRLQ